VHLMCLFNVLADHQLTSVVHQLTSVVKPSHGKETVLSKMEEKKRCWACEPLSMFLLIFLSLNPVETMISGGFHLFLFIFFSSTQ